MQSVYRIETIACHKPWRYHSTIYTQDESAFKYLQSKGDEMLEEVYPPFVDTESPDFEHEAHDEDIYEWLDKISVSGIEYPFVLLGEVRFWTQ